MAATGGAYERLLASDEVWFPDGQPIGAAHDDILGRPVMLDRAERQTYRFATLLPGALVVVFLDDDRAFRASLLDVDEGIATVWPVEPGQEDTDRPGSLEAVSRMGSKVVEGAIHPRVLPIEGDEGPVVWGELVPGQELVFQNEHNGAGTMTYTGSPINRVFVNAPE